MQLRHFFFVHGTLGSFPGESMWNFCFTKWYSGAHALEYFSFSLSVIPPMLIYASSLSLGCVMCLNS